MLIDLIDKLISRVIDLLKEEQRLKKSMHDDFVMPLMIQFEEIHQNYIQTFITYREIINMGYSPLNKKHPIFKEIKKDSLLSDSMRIKLGALWRVINERNYNPDELVRLLETIALYLKFAIMSPIPRNDARFNLTSDLVGTTREQGSFIIDKKVEELQRGFSRVQERYQDLKMKLVK